GADEERPFWISGGGHGPRGAGRSRDGGAVPAQYDGGGAPLGGGASHAGAAPGDRGVGSAGVRSREGAGAARRGRRTGETRVRGCSRGGPGVGPAAARGRAGRATRRRGAGCQIEGVIMSVQRIVGLLGWVCAAGAAPVAARAQIWLPAACDIKPGHQLVNSGMQSLRSAFTTKFADQKAKDLKDAERVLTQAVTSGKQEKNPAAWYYLGRYYLMVQDVAGADSALSKAMALAPACKEDIGLYRRNEWVGVFNAGVQAWQGGQTDSAIESFRR